MIAPGERLNGDFPVKVCQNGELKSVTFSELFTRSTIVSVFMRQGTPSCDRQIDDLVAHAAEFDRLGYQLIAVSRDTARALARYGAKKRIPFTLVSDPTDAFARAVDGIVEKSMYGRTFAGPARAAFVFARDGKTLAVIQKVDTQRHAAELRETIAAL